MTISSIYVPPQYTANGSTKIFAVPFPFFDPSDIVVNLFDAAANADVIPQPVLNGGATYDFTVTGTKDPDLGEYVAGASVVFNNAPLSNHRVTILRAVAAIQPNVFINNAPFPAKVVESSLDREAMAMQQIGFGPVPGASPSRALLTPVSDGTMNMTIPNKVARANKFLGFDANGLPIAAASDPASSTINNGWLYDAISGNTGLVSGFAGIGKTGLGIISPLHVAHSAARVQARFESIINAAYTPGLYTNQVIAFISNPGSTPRLGAALAFGVAGDGPGSVATIVAINAAADYSTDFAFTLRNAAGVDYEHTRLKSTGELVVTGGKIGIGMSPVNVLDILQIQNGLSAAQIANSNAGALARSEFRSSNGVSSALVGVTGTGFVTAGPLSAGRGYFLSDAPTGVVMGSSANAQVFIVQNNVGHTLFNITAGYTGGYLQILGHGFGSTAYNTLAPGGDSVDLPVNVGGGGFHGILTCQNIDQANSNIRTHTVFSFLGRGTAFLATPLSTGNGSSGGAPFTISCPVNGVIRMSNNHTAVTTAEMSFFGLKAS